MKEMYQLLFFPKLLPSGKEILYCRICGTNKNLTEAFKLGMYSTTHSSFVMGFFSKMSGLYGQNIMCDECYLKTLYGFNILQEKLNFYAYSLKASSSSDRIYHFIIPMINDKSLLKRSIELIYRAKKRSDEEREKSLTRLITDIDSRIEKIKREISTSSNKKIKNLKQNIAEIEKIKENYQNQLEKVDASLDIDILFETLSSADENVSILDIYYMITNVKQNPKIIEIVSDILISSKMINTLSKIFSETKKKFTRVGLSDLRRLVEDRFFLQYYSSLLGLESESKTLFNKRCYASIRKYFLADFAGVDYYGLNKKLKYYHLLDIYDRFDFMFKKANLWRDENE